MNYIIFSLDNQEYCIPMNNIEEIIDMKKITRVPMFPEYIEGLINLRGEIIPIVNLKIRMKYKTEYNNLSKIIILQGQKRYGIMVDSIKGILNKIEEKIDTKSQYIESVLKNKNKEYLLLDINKIIDIEKTVFMNSESHKQSKENVKNIKKKKIITFKINNEIYGFEIKDIFEIINYIEPGKIPNVINYVKGIITEREETIPIIDLKELLYNTESKITEYTKIAIIDIDQIKIGLIVENIHRLIEVDKIKEIPFIIKGKNILSGYIKTDEFSAVILNLSDVLNDDIKSLNKKSEKKIKNEKRKTKNKYILFEVNNEKYAIEMNLVREVNRIKNITKIPYSSPYIRGIMNLRGDVLPLIDLKIRFGNSKGIEVSQFSRIMVVNVENQLIGFLVDSVNKLVSMDYIQLKSDSRFIKGLGEYNGDSILLLDLKKVLNKNELDALNKSIEKSKIRKKEKIGNKKDVQNEESKKDIEKAKKLENKFIEKNENKESKTKKRNVKLKRSR
ncbi:chemotaxis protein CheW [Marinitoga aeolica]|uniref:Chemotaxis protein CheW n=1 Tax=Marinitoga aeolica TaxID=2809031 RepID=A0ABY8PT88_9BACT|nr:chemotaxis protein CheW [Marinitoga aeolica]WGS65855.1 chemotaxis protein CheW [Marinitoga aeolica]